ncbi:S9 family peptidase [Sediminibacterium ginsengisoli]|uniref:Dipeptidyl aminopeptidase/acylaminoacyl peptidase n=1 Tax=Sediminibacterium ginsengisoli TaxID=413434 RepID=A0A1T4LGC0_9BACT|nr:DPP IV N-terminal domain-containing protein [Sediminibacterium ginsengisoli]SJZ53544.1 Dipeptidyl aminopeptidase/acylaminoacyl peptidase [Sediminibacterium ginsengisoli]
MRNTLLVVMFCMVASGSIAQNTLSHKSNYQLASRFSPQKIGKLVFSTSVDPHWLKKSDRFWYMYETTEGKKWYIVDPVKGEKKQLFDNADLAAKISRIVKDPFDAQHLGLDSMRFIKDENWIQFEVKSTQEIEKKDTTAKKGTPPVKEKKVFYFEYNLLTAELTELPDFKKPKRKPSWASVAPDGNTVVFGRNYNLYWMDKANYEKALQNENDSTIVDHALTTDGIENYGYFSDGNLSGNGDSNIDKEKNKNKRRPVTAYWSPDSKYFTLSRTDNRKVKDLWVINSVADPRPTLETYKYWMPGEKEAPVDHVYLFDMTLKSGKEMQVSQFRDQDISIWADPGKVNTRDDDFKPLKWLGTNTAFYFTRTSRDLKRVDVCKVDVTTGAVKVLIEERLNTYIEVKRLGLVNEGKEFIQWSERDGWAHFYLYDENGRLKNQITSGAFHCEDIVGIDETKRVLYFTANGREQGEDPYYVHLYRINFDGTGIKLLNPGDFEHASGMNDGKTFFVDNYSRVNAGPRSALYASDGRKLLDLETADLSSLMATGYKFPQPFKVKADDGITDLYGVMYRPFDFDSTKKYPVIEYVYPGPQTEAVNKAFGRGMDRTDRLAQLGFVVVTIGNRGGHPARSKWYHNFGYGNLRDYGLADKKAAVEQLADRYPFIDINRVGIHGHSGGGFMSTAAMLVYPDFFKVAVSSSGNHDNAIYNRWWSEKHHGVKEVISDKADTSFVYNIEKNQDLARNLKGHLMLTTGDIDNNVHPAGTIRVANALIRANKRFDLVILPGQRHAYGDMTEYFFWRMADYFTEHLLGDKTARPVDIVEMTREQEQGKTPQRRGTPEEEQ